MPCADHERDERAQGLLCGVIFQKYAQDQHEVAVKQTCLAEAIDRLKIKWRLGGQ